MKHQDTKQTQNRNTKLLKANIWKVDGYVGHYDYDGPADNNIHKLFIMDAILSKEDVQDMLLKKYSKDYRVVVFHLTCIQFIDIDKENETLDMRDRKQTYCPHCKEDVYYLRNKKGVTKCEKCEQIINEGGNKDAKENI